MKRIIILAAFSIVSVSSLMADTIKFTLEFENKPPKVGLIYMPEAKPKDNAEAKAEVDQKNKEFSKTVVVSRQGGKIKFKNSDDVDHNIYADDSATGVKFDVGLMPKGGEIEQKVTWKEGEVVPISCKIHPRMKSYLACVDTPVYQIIEFDKEKNDFKGEMKDIDKNIKKVTVWLPLFDVISVDVETGKTITVELKKTGKDTPSGKITITRE